MPTPLRVHPLLRQQAYDDTLDADRLLTMAPASSLVDSLEVHDTLRALERLLPPDRLDDLGRTFRLAVCFRNVELYVGCIALGRRTMRQLELLAVAEAEQAARG